MVLSQQRMALAVSRRVPGVSGWACAATAGRTSSSSSGSGSGSGSSSGSGGGGSSSSRADHGQEEDHDGASHFGDGIFASGATQLSSAVSKFAGNAAAELQRAAHDDPKFRTGLPVFLAAVGAFIVLACVTFYRVRRKGGRKRPPRLDFQEMTRLSGAEET